MMTSSSQQPQNSIIPPKWTEIIGDFWKPFKNKGKLYDDNRLKDHCIKLQFQTDDTEESDSGTESWLHINPGEITIKEVDADTPQKTSRFF